MTVEDGPAPAKPTKRISQQILADDGDVFGFGASSSDADFPQPPSPGARQRRVTMCVPSTSSSGGHASSDFAEFDELPGHELLGSESGRFRSRLKSESRIKPRKPTRRRATMTSAALSNVEE